MSEFNSNRSAEVLAKQEKIARLLQEAGRDGLVVLDPGNFAWLTGGVAQRGYLDANERPALYYQNSHRWLLSSSVDSQRLFDEELDGLGFQIKEWPWAWGRDQLLADLCHGKRLATDAPLGDAMIVGDRLKQMRRVLSEPEQARLIQLGQATAHAVEAACRNFERGETEEQVAGQLTHRLVHHGMEPVSILVAADGRLRDYRRPVPTAAKVERTCVIQAVAQKWGLHAAASRSVSFGPPDEEFQKEFDMSARLSAVNIAGSAVNARPSDGLQVAMRFLQLSTYEQEWRAAPGGWLTGYAPIEQLFTPNVPIDPLEAGMAVVWPAGIGAAVSTDTILIDAGGPKIVTPADLWPLKRIRISGVLVERPDILVRQS